jgi:hypothetical protein
MSQPPYPTWSTNDPYAYQAQYEAQGYHPQPPSAVSLVPSSRKLACMECGVTRVPLYACINSCWVAA